MPEQAEQDELTCVSCDTTFDPAPNGGFCPDCDTPHPDFEMGDDGADDSADDEAESAEVEYDESDGAADSSDEDAAAFCPECGADLDADRDAESEDSDGLSACPDCGHSVTDESYCPQCGTDLDAVRAEADDEADEEAADDSADGDEAESGDEDADDESESEDDEAPAEPITLVIGDESYGFGDGDTFGRQDKAWLEALVSEAGGSDDVAYISSDHLEFAVDDEGATVRDTSRNGTKLNGTDLDGDAKELEDGDTLELAERAEITVELELGD